MILLSSLQLFGNAQAQDHIQSKAVPVVAIPVVPIPSPVANAGMQRFTEIEFEPTEGATNYDLEIYNNITKKFIKKFKSKTSTFKLNVKMGTYLIRSRITDIYKRTSEWSELNEMVIAPPHTRLTSEAPDPDVKTFADKKTNTYAAYLKWEPLPGVDKYLIVAETPEGNKITDYNVEKPELKIDLTPGVYKFKVMAVLADGTIGDASPLSDVYTILGAKILPPRLAYKKNKNGKEYIQVKSELKNAVLEGILERQSWESEIWSESRRISNAEIKDIDLDASLVPGKYKLTLSAVAKGLSNSDPTHVEFVIKPKLADILEINSEVTAALQGIDSNAKSNANEPTKLSDPNLKKE